MRMRGILVAVACAAVMEGCHESTALPSHTDATTDAVGEHGTPGTCGNGILETGEECDDGDGDDCDGCMSACTFARAMEIGGGDLRGASATWGSPFCLQCPYTVEAWFKLDSDDGRLTIINATGVLTLSIGFSFYEFATATSTGVSTMPVIEGFVPGTWHHVAVLCSGSGTTWQFSVIMDGKTTFGGYGCSGCSPERACTSLVGIGLSSMATETWSGVIDDLRVSTSALYDPRSLPFTPERHLTTTTSSIVLLTFDDTEGGDPVETEILPDATGNGNHAVLEDGILIPDECHLP